MCTRVLLFLMILLSSIYTPAQSSDFKLRIENSFLKNYENPDTAIHAAKEIRDTGDQFAIQDILAQAYLLKGDYQESVRIAFEKSNIENQNQQLLSKLIIAREFYQLNLYEQTSKIIEPLLAEIKISSHENDELYARLFQLQTENFIALKKLDEAEKSILKSSEFSKKNQRHFQLLSAENQLLNATVILAKGNLEEAKKTTDQLLKNLSSLPRANYLIASALQFRAQLFFEEQQYDKAIKYLKEALQTVENINYGPLKNSIYKDLSKNYLVIKKNEDYELFKNTYRTGSKSLEENKKAARRELIQLSTSLNAESNTLILQKKKTDFLYTTVVSLLILAFLLYFYIREIQKSKILIKQIRFFRTINFHQNRTLKEELQTRESSKKRLSIPKETEDEILQGLEQFEKSKKYLDNNMSLANLAVELNTNTKYLSEIINQYKDKNFNTYINELRVKYVIRLLSTDRSYLQYKISYIAELGGFTSHSAFTNIFKSVTGMSPNEYVQTLRLQ